VWAVSWGECRDKASLVAPSGRAPIIVLAPVLRQYESRHLGCGTLRPAGRRRHQDRAPHRVAGATGTAHISVDDAWENSIIVVSGANLASTADGLTVLLLGELDCLFSAGTRSRRGGPGAAGGSPLRCANRLVRVDALPRDDYLWIRVGLLLPVPGDLIPPSSGGLGSSSVGSGPSPPGTRCRSGQGRDA